MSLDSPLFAKMNLHKKKKKKEKKSTLENGNGLVKFARLAWNKQLI